ncbi:hypothetical protein EX895_004735 [Sporisorium graminicola]|uniref:Alpha/beta hydrolase fold-3 domain-containing protein n=1 Tax=Sporisorium graminicola TaxID=280036 RepID=A0A4U7KRF3_9BASI|nr:hypothetical protein EX895_004735 [Sporisorium graminicola]TKY86586.1 hypothetical protein EX895_004735 [Sporisorium graminicola]
MGGVLWFLRGTAAALCTTVNVFGMSIVWIYLALTRKKTAAESPNALQVYLTYVARTFLWWLTVFEAQPAHCTRTPSRLRDSLLLREFTWIQPAPVTTKEKSGDGFDTTNLPLDLEEHEKERKTAAYWFKTPKSLADGPKPPVILHFHGGAYITLEASDIFMGVTMARMMAKYGEADVLTVSYRLAPGSKYPTQLFEAYSSWLHLRSLGYDSIWLSGDSAGANLVLTLWRYLVEHRGAEEARAVAGLALHSPWLDMKGHETQAFQEKEKTCVIGARYVRTGLRKLQRGGLPDANDPWLSPTYWSDKCLSHLPRVFCSNGGAETLLHEAEQWLARARQQGASVYHYVAPDHPHDFSAMFWFYPSIRHLFLAQKEWMRDASSAPRKVSDGNGGAKT